MLAQTIYQPQRKQLPIFTVCFLYIQACNHYISPQFITCKNASRSFLQQQNCHSITCPGHRKRCYCANFRQYEIHAGNYLVWQYGQIWYMLDIGTVRIIQAIKDILVKIFIMDSLFDFLARIWHCKSLTNTRLQKLEIVKLSPWSIACSQRLCICSGEACCSPSWSTGLCK